MHKVCLHAGLSYPEDKEGRGAAVKGHRNAQRKNFKHFIINYKLFLHSTLYEYWVDSKVLTVIIIKNRFLFYTQIF